MILQKPIQATVENVESYTVVCLAIHNYLRFLKLPKILIYCHAGFVDSESSIGEIIPGDWRNDVNDFRDVTPIRGSRYSLGVIEMRENLKNYLNNKEGSLRWQLDYVRKTTH